MNKEKTNLSLPKELCRGERVKATYHEPEIEAYQGNPLLEALPFALTKTDLRKRLQQLPTFSQTDLTKSIPNRLQLLSANLASFFQPLIRHVRLEQSVSQMIRRGYIGRNPLALGHYNSLTKADRLKEKLVHPGSLVYSTPSALLTGMSGTGKSYSLEKILKLTPQVIDHGEYKGKPFSHTQLVWLKLDCPNSTKGLCTFFFQAVDQLLGTNYLVNYWGRNGTVSTMVPGLARVALLHSLGLLVLDESQNLRAQASGGREELLNFIVQIENTLGVPVLLVGNASVMKAFAGGFRQVRRGTGLLEPHWFRMSEDSKEWEHFMTALWHYNCLASKSELTKELRSEFYYHTQGVADFVVKLFEAVQTYLINQEEDEKITEEIIATVAHQTLFRSEQIISALRHRDPTSIEKTDDISEEDVLGNKLPIELLEHLNKLAEQRENLKSKSSKASKQQHGSDEERAAA